MNGDQCLVNHHGSVKVAVIIFHPLLCGSINDVLKPLGFINDLLFLHLISVSENHVPGCFDHSVRRKTTVIWGEGCISYCLRDKRRVAAPGIGKKTHSIDFLLLQLIRMPQRRIYGIIGLCLHMVCFHILYCVFPAGSV